MGRPWQLFSLAKIMEITATVKIPVLGGGIFTYDDAVRHLMAGCNLAGMYSAIYSRGIKVLKEAITGLDMWMDKKGYKSVEELCGMAIKDFMYLRDWNREKEMSEITPIIPEFNNDTCNRCGICEELCPYGAITLDKDRGAKPHSLREYCFGCGWCVGRCPKHAVRMIHADTSEMNWDGYGTIAVPSLHRQGG